MRTLIFCLGVLACCPTPARAFDTTSIVGAAENSDGVQGACVVVSSSKIRCGFLGAGGSWTWCSEQSLPANFTTYSSTTGIYLVQDYQTAPFKSGYAFLPVYDSTDVYWGVERFQLYWDPASKPTCVYGMDFHFFPYITGQTHPDVGRHLAVADGPGSTDSAYVFTIDPTSDSYASGSLLGAAYASQGGGAITDFYATGSYGITGARDFDPGSATSGGPIAAIKSSLSGLPLVVGVETSTTNYYDAVYEDTTNNWHLLTSGSLPMGDTWASFSIAGVPSQTVGLTSYGDSIFGVGTDTKLYETKFEYGTAYFLGSLSLIGQNGGNELDSSTDSLAASYYYPNSTTPPRAIAYARRDASNGDAASTDLVNGGATVWSDYCSNIPANTNYDGVQTNIAQSWNQDTVFSACDDGLGGTTLCVFSRSWGATTQTWSLY